MKRLVLSSRFVAALTLAFLAVGSATPIASAVGTDSVVPHCLMAENN